MTDIEMVKLLDSVKDEDVPLKSFKDVVNIQRRLYNHYCKNNQKCGDKDFMCQQMVLAIIDELAEYDRWKSNDTYIEAMFEAIDMYHFALEGLIITVPSIANNIPGIRHYDHTDIYQSCSRILDNINWKHWKRHITKTADNHLAASDAFSRLCDIAYTMFAEAYQDAYGGGIHDMELVDKKELDRKFFKFYYVKNMENFDRQKRGY